MIKRMLAIGFIFGGFAIGWAVLAAVTEVRSYEQDEALGQAVSQLWGSAQRQVGPRVFYLNYKNVQVTRDLGDRVVVETVRQEEQVDLPLRGSDLDVSLSLEHRRKGLLWFPTYRVQFRGTYRLINTTAEPRTVFFAFPLPAYGAVFDDFLLLIGEQAVEDLEMKDNQVVRALELPAGVEQLVTVGYSSQGLDQWVYAFGQDVRQVRDFKLRLRTDFAAIDFPPESLSPTTKQEQGAGWLLEWKYENLLSGVQLGMLMPRLLNPGPWVSRLTLFAPVSLFFFFFLLFIFGVARGLKVHPMNYFFLGAAFFAFHLLLAYLVDHLSIHLAFWIAALVSISLVVSYMRLVVNARFAMVEIGLSQLVYLVGFSYTFFFQGATGLSVTLLCVATLFVVMQYTGRLDWERVFREAAGTKPPEGEVIGSRTVI